MIMAHHILQKKDSKAVPKIYETRFINKKKAIRDILLTIDLIPLTKKNIMTLLDITERKQIENKLKNAYNRLDFYKDLLAHDMGNILNNIKSSVQLCEIWQDTQEKEKLTREILEIINQQVERGISLIINIRKLSELYEDKFITKPVNVVKILKKAIDFTIKRFNEMDVSIKLSPFEQNIFVNGGDLLIDAFENILINGIIHNDNEKIKIDIDISKLQKKKKKFIKIEFRDNGRGIIDIRKKIIFKRVYKRERSTAGSGIGLSLVKRIIDGYKGQIWVENRVKGDFSKGSNFIILLSESNHKKAKNNETS